MGMRGTRRALALLVRLGSVLFVHGGLLDKPNVMRGNKGANIYEMTRRAQERIHERMTGPVGPIGPIGPIADGPPGPPGPDGPRGLLVAMREAIREYTDYACSAESGLRCANVTEARGYAELKRKDICTNSETRRLVHEEGTTLVVVGHCLTHTLKERTVDEDHEEEGTVEAMRAECKRSTGGDSKAGGQGASRT